MLLLHQLLVVAGLVVVVVAVAAYVVVFRCHCQRPGSSLNFGTFVVGLDAVRDTGR